MSSFERELLAERNGPRAATYSSLGVYTGEWHANRREGEGYFEWKNGNVYSGMWKADRRHGEGVFWYDPLSIPLFSPIQGEGSRRRRIKESVRRNVD